MTIEQRIKEAAEEHYVSTFSPDEYNGFILGAEWMLSEVESLIKALEYYATDCEYEDRIVAKEALHKLRGTE